MRSREAQEPDSSDFGCGLLRIIANLRQSSPTNVQNIFCAITACPALVSPSGLQTQEVSCRKKFERSNDRLQSPGCTSRSRMSTVSGTGSKAKDILREPSTGSFDCLGTGPIGFTWPGLPLIRSMPDTTHP